MKLPKHITDALGRPRCACPVTRCGASVEITAKGQIARHRVRLDPFNSQCPSVGSPAPEGAALEWLTRETESHRKRADGFREDVARATKNASYCDAMAAELEKVIARESGK